MVADSRPMPAVKWAQSICWDLLAEVLKAALPGIAGVLCPDIARFVTERPDAIADGCGTPIPPEPLDDSRSGCCAR